MTETYLDLPPPSGPITEIHVWLATYPDGSEGIVSADLALPHGIRHTPLMSSKRHIAEQLAPMARGAQRAAMHQSDRIVRLRLVTFRRASEPHP